MPLNASQNVPLKFMNRVCPVSTTSAALCIEILEESMRTLAICSETPVEIWGT